MEKKNRNKFDVLLNTNIEGALAQIAEYFKNGKFSVSFKPQFLELSLADGPRFRLRYLEGEFYFKRNLINKEEKKITREIKKYSAKIEVEFDGLYEVLQDYTTMERIQEILLTHHRGVIYLWWNREVIEY